MRALARPAEPTVNPLEEYFRTNQGRLLHKWMHYFDIYDRHFRPFRGTDVTLVEFGVFHGGSLQMWKHYFGPRARIIGVDVNPACKQLEEDRIEIVIGDQEDRAFLAGLRDRVGPADIVIDDGGHTMAQQIATFEEMFQAVRYGGVYLVEDLHTSYWEEYGGGLRSPGSFIEYAKDLVDQLHGWHIRQDPPPVTDYTRQLRGMHVYDSVIVFDKEVVPPPDVRKTGRESF
ncbi:MAG TPA: class I SAM-dependent methyltransferase [Acidimicrobiales bacterium]|nr:class I SAM-dependent methyltransferase [Acidimicrobiales bacterium]